MKFRSLLIVFLSLLVILGGGYLGFGYFLHQQLADISDGCGDQRVNRPDRFFDVRDHWGDYNVDPTPFFMPSYETVSFPSREPGIEISAWYVESDPANPAVVIVHGLGGCKYAVTELAPAGMLAGEGFNVLIMDVRDAGDSTFEDGLSAIGNEEYLDVLGAVDWLDKQKNFSPQQVGILGNSLGAATALIAFSQEPAVGAVFVDSPFDNLPQIIREELEREGYPQFLYRAGIWAAWLITGDRLLAYNPYEALDLAAGRPVFVVHGTADNRIGVHHSQQLRVRAEELGVPAEFWILDGVGHVQALGSDPNRYETRLVDFFRRSLKGIE